MPLQPSVTEIRLNNITRSLTAASDTLQILARGLKSPFLAPIANTIVSLLAIAQTVKQNKTDCIELMEQIHGLLYAIIALHTKSDTGGDMSPSLLNDLGKFTGTLHKIYTFVEAQQEKNMIKKLFRTGEMTTLFKYCQTGLKAALDVFKVRSLLSKDIFRMSIFSATLPRSQMQRYAEHRHLEVLELIHGSSDAASSIDGVFLSSHDSSNSICMLPSEPKIFHGRDTELADILRLFMQETARVAILGAGGMGKTSLARAVLHHPDITDRYGQYRAFVPCDSVSTQVELAALIGAHLGVKQGKNLTKAVVQQFSRNPPSLLILDNLETLWEPTTSRADIEEFLSLLTDVSHLAIIVTMRGSERPAKVRWSRPCLKPLTSLTQDAARQTFLDIADDGHESADVDRVLLLTDNIPLAIDLLAHLVDSEGCSPVLSRWNSEKTSLFSEGYDKRSNLDLSILLSLSSPRMTSMPHARDLLSVLSLLPDGLADVDLQQSSLPINNILGCKATLLRTSLAYNDDQGRVKVLVPIREYVQKFHYPGSSLLQPLVTHFYGLLDIQREYSGTAISGSRLVPLIRGNFANIQNLLLDNLHADNPDIVNAIRCTLYFDGFMQDFGGSAASTEPHNGAPPRHQASLGLDVATGRRYVQGTSIEQDQGMYAWIILNTAEIEVRMDTPRDDVQKKIEAAQAIFDSTKYLRGRTYCDMVSGELNLREGNESTADALLQQCVKYGWGKMDDIVTSSLETLGDRSRWSGTDLASTWTMIFLAHDLKTKQKLGVYKALQFLGNMFHAESDNETAVTCLTLALEGFTHSDIHLSKAECMLCLGDVSNEQGHLLQAMGCWTATRPLFERASQSRGVAEIEGRIALVSQNIAVDVPMEAFADLHLDTTSN